MKYLTVAIPSYNSQEYMDHAIESCLLFPDEVEIIIVDDGSKDNTGKIGDEYALKYPNTIRCIHQENGGHGQAVNTGLKNASGLYYKVLDSDDWFEENAYRNVMQTIKKQVDAGERIDMFIANYVYNKPSENRTSPIRYTNIFPENKKCTWSDTKHFLPQQNLLMHSIIYRTQLLKDCKLELPKHTFYVDNLFAYIPLPYVRTMYYMNEDLYQYYIGREGQSVNEQIMIKRIDQQLLVNKIMIDTCHLDEYKDEHLKTYMVKYLSMLTTVSSVLCIKANTEECKNKKDELWEYFKSTNYDAYKAVKHTLTGAFLEVKGPIGEKFLMDAYKVSQKLFNFN